MTQEELKIELEELAVRFSEGWHEGIKIDASDIMLLNMAAQALAQSEQEPVAIDQATMELAESVGLIGPTSRTHDLHQAIQRFHDLICVNATVKAAQMAADVIRESTQPQRRPLTAEQLELLWDEAVDRMEHFCSQYWDFARAIEAAHGIKENT